LELTLIDESLNRNKTWRNCWNHLIVTLAYILCEADYIFDDTEALHFKRRFTKIAKKIYKKQVTWTWFVITQEAYIRNNSLFYQGKGQTQRDEVISLIWVEILRRFKLHIDISHTVWRRMLFLDMLMRFLDQIEDESLSLLGSNWKTTWFCCHELCETILLRMT